MESLGQAARRLLGRLERAAKAKEIERRLDLQVSRSARHTPRCCQPPAVEEGIGIDRDPEGTLDGVKIVDSAKPLALGREGLFPRRPSRPSGAQVAANDNRLAGGAGLEGNAAGRSRAREEDCAEGVHDRTPYGEGSSFARDRSMESALRAWASDMPSAFAISSVSRPKRNRLYADGVH